MQAASDGIGSDCGDRSCSNLIFRIPDRSLIGYADKDRKIQLILRRNNAEIMCAGAHKVVLEDMLSSGIESVRIERM